MSRTAKIPMPITQYDLDGNPIQVFDRLKHLKQKLSIGYNKIEKVVVYGLEYKGYRLKAAREIVLPEKSSSIEYSLEPYWEGRQPWEGDNGIFDIEGWAKMC